MTPVTLDIRADKYRIHWFSIFQPSWDSWMIWNWMHCRQ